MNEQVTKIRPGIRVRYVGMTNRADGPTGRVVTVGRAGVRVRWDDGRVERVHPDDVRIDLPVRSI